MYWRWENDEAYVSGNTSGQKRQWFKMLPVKKCPLGNILEVDANPIEALQIPDDSKSIEFRQKHNCMYDVV